MSHNPNTIESQHQLSTTNDGKRSSEVLLSAIAELEKTKGKLELAKSIIFLLFVLNIVQFLLEIINDI